MSSVLATHMGLLNPNYTMIYTWDFYGEFQTAWVIKFNTLRPRLNVRHFADAIFKHVFLNWNIRILIKISLVFVPDSPINNNPTLVQIMAWRQPYDKPLSEPMMIRLPTHICVSRPQWVNGLSWTSGVKVHEIHIGCDKGEIWDTYCKFQVTFYIIMCHMWYYVTKSYQNEIQLSSWIPEISRSKKLSLKE